MQYDLGETETGSLTLGQIVFLPGPQMIQTVVGDRRLRCRRPSRRSGLSAVRRLRHRFADDRHEHDRHEHDRHRGTDTTGNDDHDPHDHTHDAG